MSSNTLPPKWTAFLVTCTLHLPFLCMTIVWPSYPPPEKKKVVEVTMKPLVEQFPLGRKDVIDWVVLTSGLPPLLNTPHPPLPAHLYESRVLFDPALGRLVYFNPDPILEPFLKDLQFKSVEGENPYWGYLIITPEI